MGWLEDFGNNLCDAFSNVGQCFELAGKQFSNGNFWGGVSNSLSGIGGAIGNTITLGGANAIGNAIEDGIKNDTGVGFVNAIVDYAAKNEAESIVTQMDLCEGRYSEYEFDEKAGAFVATSTVYAQTDEQREQFKTMANVMGAVDTAGKAVDVVTTAVDVATLGSTFAAKQGAKAAGKEFLKAGTKEAAKKMTKESAKKVSEKLVGEAVEKGVKEGAEKLVGEAVEKGVKEGAEKAAEEAVKKGAKEAAKETAKKATKEGAKEVVEEGTKKIAKSAIEETGSSLTKHQVKSMTKAYNRQLNKRAATIIGGSLGVDFVADRLVSGKTAVDIEMKGAATALTDACSDVMGGAVGVAGAAVGDVAGGIENLGMAAFAAEHPTLARFLNTCKAAFYAAKEKLMDTKMGTYAVAAVTKVSEKVKHTFKDTVDHYDGKSISEVAAELTAERNAKTGGEKKSLSEHYARRVTQLDQYIGLNSSDRTFTGNLCASYSGVAPTAGSNTTDADPDPDPC